MDENPIDHHQQLIIIVDHYIKKVTYQNHPKPSSGG
jgi:hypothetical protein